MNNYHIIIYIGKKSNVKYKYQEIKVVWDGKKATLQKCSLTRTGTRKALSCPSRESTLVINYSCHHACMNTRTAVPWKSRAHNQFVIFPILNILFLTLSHILNFYIYMYLYMN